jgi:hypothetical protein
MTHVRPVFERARLLRMYVWGAFEGDIDVDVELQVLREWVRNWQPTKDARRERVDNAARAYVEAVIDEIKMDIRRTP